MTESPAIINSECNNNGAEEQVAVESRNLMLTYFDEGKTTTVLDKFNIKIPKGCVYALIGPSGSGKTTYLRSLIGLKILDAGETRLFGLTLGHPLLDIPGCGLGYMPQDTALNDNLTISEIINYFGALYRIPNKECKAKAKVLCQRLGLPEESRSIGQLSGGQKRRVSFICTLIHKPRLMILDEPTVGCDPIVIEVMWQCILEIARSFGTTVIVTTHYLEEARKTDMIGFMRKGHLLAQGSPAKIMNLYKVSSIEKAFAIMVKQDKIRRSITPPSGTLGTIKENKTTLEPSKSPFSSNNTFRLKTYLQIFLAVLHRVLLIYIKSKTYLIATTLLTLTLISLSAICFGPTPHNLDIGFINNESPVEYSHSFIHSINTHIINLVEYNDTGEAEDDMKAGKIRAYLTISLDYTEKMISKLTFSQGSSKINASLASRRLVTLYQLKADMHSVTIVHYLTKALNASAWRISRHVLHHPMLAQSPILNVDPIAEPELEEDQYNSRNYFIQVFTMHWTFFVFLYLSISTFHDDITTPLYERSISAGSTPTQFILSHLISSLLLPSLISLPVMIFIIDIFHATAKGSLFLTWLSIW
ncbi:ABC transporter G family member 23 isoform X2 [Tetranychus urticae]|uniref:ABC transporter G family member 23 isoform X2 n=1 Tax=Tetranychus urticae TaxID=32264 RepID=UPI000D652FFD|nr:ABC transporter G family member 23 isoform X2 [Tetranychus urticae]